jgi:tetratricopeptide (TPR) repeat protein
MKAARAAFVFLFWVAGTAAAKDTWIEARSEHFTLLTDASKGRAGEILEDLENLRRLIAQMNPSLPLRGSTPAGIYAFRSEKSMRDFQPLRDGKPEDLAWMFQPTSFQNFVAFRADGSRDYVREIVFQEYLNLVISYGRVAYPLWLQNGFSLFYGNAHFTKAGAEVGKMHDRHRRELGEFRMLPLQQLFAVTYDSPEYRDGSRRALVDAQSWALMHYILIGLNPNGAAAIDRFLGLLAEGHDPLLAFQQAMGRPVSEIDAEVSTYIRKNIYQFWKVNLPPLETERSFLFTELSPEVADARLGRLLIGVRRYDDARARLSASVEAAPDLPDAYEALGLLARTEGKSEESLSFLERAVDRGSTDPGVHFYFASALLDASSGSGEIPEPVRAKALASISKTLAADPSHADAARLFGFLCLFDGNHQEGVGVVKKALDTNPGNPYLWFVLGQLYGKQENYSASRAIYEDLIARKLDPAFIAQIRRQLDWVVAKMGSP